jgi:peptidoglycan/LPS O-acetylase OafA/YrhL
MAASDISGRASWLQNKIFVFLGEASFSLYMTHALFLGAFCLAVPALFPEMLQSTTQGELMRLVYLTYAILISAGCFYFVETPIRYFLLRRFNAASQAGQGNALERFRAKWMPARFTQAGQNDELGLRRDTIGSENT